MNISSNRSNQSQAPFIVAKCRRNDASKENNTDNNKESSEETDTEEKLLAVYYRAGRLGAAYYTIQTGELYILGEIVDRPPNYLMFRNLFRQVDPVKLLLEGKSEGNFVQNVKKVVFENDAENEGACKLIFLSPKEYNFEGCKRRIFTLSLPNEPPNCSEDERILFLRTVLDFNQCQSVQALGALLKYLDFNWSQITMDMHTKPQFLSLRNVSIEDIVTIDEDTYRGLQIFSSESHPSNFKKGVHGSNREGLSIYHIFNKCSSKVGQNRMRVFLQHPTRDITTLTERQEVIAFFMKPQNDVIMKNIRSSLRFVKNVNGILAKIKGLSAKYYQWKSLYNTLYNAILICEACENAANANKFLQELASLDNHKLYEMASYMNRIIDFDLSKSERKFTVKAGVDEELDMKKQTMASLHGLMSETAKVELEKLPPFIEECTMIYMPHLGYLLGVKQWAENLTMRDMELPDMKFMFSNNGYIHYKNKGCEELDVMVGDTYPEIVAHETRIMMRLTAVILENLYTLATVVEKCAELDCLIAMSIVCREHNYVRPALTEDKVINIKQGRHPLQTITCENFVPNDTAADAETSCVRVLTGPNSSGKSVYMKQIGLIVYLAHIGSFVPAESATIGIISHIFTRIQSAECIASHMSAFLIDLRQMALVVQESTVNSLILIDEFGKGTTEVDGVSLLAASLNTLLYREAACPHVYISTHYLNIKDLLVDTSIVKFLRFEYILHEGELVFLFRVSEGIAETSFTHKVAASNGIDRHIINRAKEVMDFMTNGSVPAANKKLLTKLSRFTAKIKNDLVAEDI